MLEPADLPGAYGRPRGRPVGPAPGLVDGVYRVTTSYLCAGFVVVDEHVVDCAPILRRRLAYWVRVAELVDASGLSPDG
jgi:hypothetical protein